MLNCVCNLLTAQEKLTEEIPDTLYFYLDHKYLELGRYESDKYYIKDALEDKGSSETIFFRTIEINKDLRPKKILDLKEFIRISGFYHPQRRENCLDSRYC